MIICRQIQKSGNTVNQFIYILTIIVYLLFPILCSTQTMSGNWNLHTIDHSSFGADGTKLFDADHDGDLDIICGWEQGNIARLYLNSSPQNEWPFVEVPAPAVEDAIVADLDQDGSTDIITFSEGKHQRITIHWAPVKEDYLDKEKWHSTDIPATINITQWMFGQVMDVDGKNGPDLVVGSKNNDAILGWLEAPKDARKMEDWKLHTIASAGWIMSIEIVDINNDDRMDILISDRYGDSSGVKWFENPGLLEVNKENKWNAHSIGLNNKHPMFLDIERNSNGIGWEIWVPEASDGLYHFSQTDPDGLTWKVDKLDFPEFSGTVGKSTCIGDVNGDGVAEIISTYEKAENRSGVVCSYYDPVEDKWQHQDISGINGIKYDFARLLDLDGDGDPDILTSEENNNSDKIPGLGVIWYENPWIDK